MTVEARREAESETEVLRMGKWKRNEEQVGFVHSQVLRIREEDSHLGEDIGEGLSAKDNKNAGGFIQRVEVRRVDVVLLSRPILPCSPLSGKTTFKALH